MLSRFRRQEFPVSKINDTIWLYGKEKMTYFQATFLAVVQGLTEFLPISSSGHLVIFQKLFGLESPVLFDVLIHVGTLGSILVYFRKELAMIAKGFVKGKKEPFQLILLVLLGTIPASIVGFFLQSRIEEIFGSLKLLAISFLITASLLFSTKFFGRQRPKHLGRWPAEKRNSSEVEELGWRDALFVGFFQAVAILPGVSRSGSTIVAGLWRGIKQETALQLSFFLAIPAILGALVLQIPDLAGSRFNMLNQSILGMVIAGVIGYLALNILQRILKQGKLWKFGFYCLFLGLLIFIPR